MSVPVASVAKPAAKAAAEPPDDPPGLHAICSMGCAPNPTRTNDSRPKGTIPTSSFAPRQSHPPLAVDRSSDLSHVATLLPVKASEPYVVRCPAIFCASLTASVTPSSGGHSSQPAIFGLRRRRHGLSKWRSPNANKLGIELPGPRNLRVHHVDWRNLARANSSYRRHRRKIG